MILRLTQLTGLSTIHCLRLIGVSKSRFSDWKVRYGSPNQHNGLVPRDTWLLETEKLAIIDYYGKNPQNGCRRLSYMMMDEDVAFVSHNSVHRVLKEAGLIDKSTAKPSLKGTGFVQPTHPHQQWHIDISYINAGGTFYYLCSILDGYSRFIVHWEIKESMTQDECQMVVQRAKENVSADKVRLISDNGPQFKAKQFKEYLKKCGMDQTYTSPYYPQSNGKLERWHKELKSTCIRPKSPSNYKEAKKYVGQFVESYNYQRLHSAIGYVTPYDRMLGIDKELIENRKLKLKRAHEIRKLEWQRLKNNNSVDVHRMEPPSQGTGAETEVYTGGEHR